LKYRSEIDGLRALAVVPVILFHAGVTLFSGGFVGVDVFFVISGYLITTVIIQDLDTGKFSIVSFYERRARRILPALFLVVIISAVAAWFFLGPLDGKKFAQSILGVITFTSNIMFWLDDGYFESASELKPLLHTWSLAVEEQYYLFFPLLLMWVYRYAWKYVVVLLSALAILSFALMEWAVMLSAVSPAIVSAGFFLLPTRGWELLIGGLVAFHLSQGKAELPLATRNILSAAGGGMILWAIISFDEHIPFPSHVTLLPTLGTALIILYATTDTLTKAVLSNRLLVAVGWRPTALICGISRFLPSTATARPLQRSVRSHF
jgi:peptidoglycan/LPS O-acetylase OafA/YrhL